LKQSDQQDGNSKQVLQQVSVSLYSYNIAMFFLFCFSEKRIE